MCVCVWEWFVVQSETQAYLMVNWEIGLTAFREKQSFD